MKEMTLADREKLLKAGFYPVEPDYWLYIGDSLHSQEDREKFNWARRNRYSQEIMPYSEGYLLEAGIENAIRKAFLHEDIYSRPDPWEEEERIEFRRDGYSEIYSVVYRNKYTGERTKRMSNEAPKDENGKLVIDPA